MNATEPTAAPAPARFLDVLPTRGGKRQALEWCPHSEDYEHGEGFVTLTSDRDQTRYCVTEAPERHGRCFLFSKVSGKGSDPTKESYLIVCDRDGTHGRCECKGFSRHGHCRHCDAAQTLIANRWL